MKGGMWPAGDALYQAMFHRVDVHVIDVRAEIRLITKVLPITTLPDAPFAPLQA